MRDEVDWESFCAAFAEHGELEERVPRDELVAADRGQQRDAAFQGSQPCRDARGDDLAG